MSNEPREAQALAELAGMTVSAERLAALAAGLDTTRRIGQVLARLVHGDTAPACSFRVPPAEPR